MSFTQPRRACLFPLWRQVNRAAARVGHDERRIAAELGLCLRQLQRHWRALGDGTLEEWLQDHRLLEAIHLLQVLGWVKEAADLAGYPSSAPFCRTFKRSQGMSPGRYFAQYRQRQPLWRDPEMASVRLRMQAETREFFRQRQRWVRRSVRK